jgi:signal transduction histidine kinase
VICLVDDLLATAALESGRVELRMAPMDLATVAQQVIDGMRWQADAKRQLIEFPAPPADVGLINGDVARLRQVIANLVSNAIKFSPPGETIMVTLTRDEHAVRLSVRDRGAGIPEKDIPRLFAPFQGLATHPTASESSHGLGLSIAQEIAQRHGGHLYVESQPGDGSTFTIHLPAWLG